MVEPPTPQALTNFTEGLNKLKPKLNRIMSNLFF